MNGSSVFILLAWLSREDCSSRISSVVNQFVIAWSFSRLGFARQAYEASVNALSVSSLRCSARRTAAFMRCVANSTLPHSGSIFCSTCCIMLPSLSEAVFSAISAASLLPCEVSILAGSGVMFTRERSRRSASMQVSIVMSPEGEVRSVCSRQACVSWANCLSVRKHRSEERRGNKASAARGPCVKSRPLSVRWKSWKQAKSEMTVLSMSGFDSAIPRPNRSTLFQCEMPWTPESCTSEGTVSACFQQRFTSFIVVCF